MKYRGSVWTLEYSPQYECWSTELSMNIGVQISVLILEYMNLSIWVSGVTELMHDTLEYTTQYEYWSTVLSMKYWSTELSMNIGVQTSVWILEYRPQYEYWSTELSVNIGVQNSVWTETFFYSITVWVVTFTIVVQYK